MKTETLPLKETTINLLYNSPNKTTYEIPIYQRNYAWGKDEISALIQDVYDAYIKSKKNNNNSKYYIGTLVSYNRGDYKFEIIDGQQRLTTIKLILDALDKPTTNTLTYRARKKSDDTIKNLNVLESKDIDKDDGIVYGYKYAKSSIDEIVPKIDRDMFTQYFLNNVCIIHYQVPKDIDLNHYFEIMNSRGEQLEKHEIIKARLISALNDDKNENADHIKESIIIFNYIWEACSQMSTYIQQNIKDESIFGKEYGSFVIDSFEGIVLREADSESNNKTIEELTLSVLDTASTEKKAKNSERPDAFQPIIDFSNFLLIVLKITRITDDNEFDPTLFSLDDKELIKEFESVKTLDATFAKRFAFNLLKTKYLIDNYVVHHTNDEDNIDSNPWMLQVWKQTEGKSDRQKKGYLRNLAETNEDLQSHLVQLLSMFEVSFTARQRKNYLFYCLLYLFRCTSIDLIQYKEFVEHLSEKYFRDVYMVPGLLNEINTPTPGSFDNTILKQRELDVTIHNHDNTFDLIYGDGGSVSKGVPLYVFNYLDYKLWITYAEELRGERKKENSKERKEFFEKLGCSDFGLDVFDRFYFSRTRRSLEHYYPQANATGLDGHLDEKQINCFGNYAMIGSEANSAGSNWSPKTKIDSYLDSSRKIRQISVSSLKFWIMMQMCKDNADRRAAGQEWNYEDIQKHQRKMELILRM